MIDKVAICSNCGEKVESPNPHAFDSAWLPGTIGFRCNSVDWFLRWSESQAQLAAALNHAARHQEELRAERERATRLEKALRPFATAKSFGNVVGLLLQVSFKAVDDARAALGMKP